VKGLLCVWLGCLAGSLGALTSPRASETHAAPATVVLVVGAAGQEDFGRQFRQWAQSWQEAGARAGACVLTIGLEEPGATNDLQRLQETLRAQSQETTSDLWLVLLGHGTFDGQEAKFNLRGPDLSTTELAALLQPIHRPVAVIAAFSSSAPFLTALSGTNRVILTATRSGYEQNFARFGRFISQAITAPEADLDKDGQTSLLEAFLMASRGVAEFYEHEARLATEHPLLDDNGDGLGTPADWFRGIRPVKQSAHAAPVDGRRAHQFHLLRSPQEQQLPPEVRARRDELELAIGKLRDAKNELAEAEYYRRLELLLLDLARLYETNAPPPAKPALD
jgi:hypothetical protein